MRPFTQSSLGTQQALEWLWSNPAHLKLVPHAVSVAEAQRESLPAELEEKSKNLRKSFLMQALLLASVNRELLSAFDSAGIRAIPMKGPVLTERLYGGLHHRPFGDLDILVQPAQLDEAKNLVLEAGFEDVTRNPRLFHLEFTRKNQSGSRVHLELHRRLIGYAIGGDHLAFGIAGSKGFSEWCWKRSVSAEGHWQMEETDELLYLCLHLAKHLIMERKLASSGLVCSSLLLARDIQLVLAQWEIDRDEFSRTVDRFHLTFPVGLALAFTFRWFSCDTRILAPLAKRVSERRLHRFLDWADNTVAVDSTRSLEVNQRVQMVIEAFYMADRWSDRLKILPFVAGELLSRRNAEGV